MCLDFRYLTLRSVSCGDSRHECEFSPNTQANAGFPSAMVRRKAPPISITTPEAAQHNSQSMMRATLYVLRCPSVNSVPLLLTAFEDLFGIDTHCCRGADYA